MAVLVRRRRHRRKAVAAGQVVVMIAGRRRRRLWFGSADDSRPDAARLLVAVEDFRDAAVGDAELSGDDARTDSGRGQLDDFESDVVGQRTAVDKDAAQLVDPALA